MEFIDPYGILGLTNDATEKEIKHAYRELVQIHHPDKETGDEELFIQITWAYKFLMDTEKRKLFDDTGTIIDDQNEFEIQSGVKEVLINLFMTITSKPSFVQNHKTNDLFKLIKREVTTNITTQEKLIKERKIAIELFNDMKKRITTKEKQKNFFDCLITDKISEAERYNEISNRNIIILNRAIETLDMFEYQVDDPFEHFGSFLDIKGEEPNKEQKYFKRIIIPDNIEQGTTHI